MRPTTWFLLTALAVFALTRGADASAPITARLEWEKRPGAESCVDGAAIARAIHHRWGREVFTRAPTADIVLRGSAERRVSGEWAVTLSLHGKDGENLGSRELVTPAADCSSLDDSIALAAGLMVDVTQREMAEKRASTPPPPTPERPLRIPKETLAPRAPWHADVALGGAAMVGLLPGVALGLRGAIGVEPPRFWRLAVGATWWAETETPESGAGVRLSLVTFDLRICPAAWEPAPLVFHVCAVQRIGAIRASGVGFDETTSSQGVVATVGPAVDTRLRVAGPLELVGALGAEIPVLRHRFVYRDAAGRSRPIHGVAPLTGTASVGAAWRW